MRSTLELADISATLPNLGAVAAAEPLAVQHGGGLGPYIPDGSFIYGFYDAANYSPARAARPYFTTDSSVTLTSWNRLRCMALARWAYINVPVVRAMEDLLARLTVGTGFKPVTKGSNKGISALYDRVTQDAFRTIDFQHGTSMDELNLHDCRGGDIDGDLGYVLTENEAGTEKLQLIEGHRIQSSEQPDPRCKDGVWVDKYDREAFYNVRVPGNAEGEFTRISVKDFHYMAERDRPDELRTMSKLVPALNPLQDLYEIVSFATGSAKKNAETGIVITTPTPNDPPLGGPRGMIVRPPQGYSVGQPAIPAMTITTEQIYGAGGKALILRPGEKVESFSHNHPAPTLEAWSEFIIRGICSARGLPFEILWSPEKIGGANTRMLTAILRAFLSHRRQRFIFPKLSRARFWILSRRIKRGELPFDAQALFNVTWQPNFIDITTDAGRESRERRSNVLCGLDTFTSYDAENGNDYLTESLPTRQAETDAQCVAAEDLAKKHPWLKPADALNRLAQLTPNGNGGSGHGADGGSNPGSVVSEAANIVSDE